MGYYTKRRLWDMVVDQEQKKIDAWKRVRELERQLAHERARADQAEAVVDVLSPSPQLHPRTDGGAPEDAS